MQHDRMMVSLSGQAESLLMASIINFKITVVSSQALQYVKTWLQNLKQCFAHKQWPAQSGACGQYSNRMLEAQISGCFS
jgi:hypothetical protein